MTRAICSTMRSGRWGQKRKHGAKDVAHARLVQALPRASADHSSCCWCCYLRVANKHCGKQGMMKLYSLRYLFSSCIRGASLMTSLDSATSASCMVPLDCVSAAEINVATDPSIALSSKFM